MGKELIVRWSPANPWWWGYHRMLWGYRVVFYKAKY